MNGVVSIHFKELFVLAAFACRLLSPVAVSLMLQFENSYVKSWRETNFRVVGGKIFIWVNERTSNLQITVMMEFITFCSPNPLLTFLFRN